jgi:hypothetical protein
VERPPSVFSGSLVLGESICHGCSCPAAKSSFYSSSKPFKRNFIDGICPKKLKKYLSDEKKELPPIVGGRIARKLSKQKRRWKTTLTERLTAVKSEKQEEGD